MILFFGSSLYSQDINSYGTCIDGPLRIRQGPTTSSEIVGKLQTGDSFKVLGRSSYLEKIGQDYNYWYKIEFQQNTIGYAFGEFIKVNNTIRNSDFDIDEIMKSYRDLEALVCPYDIVDSTFNSLFNEFNEKTTGSYYVFNYDVVTKEFYVISSKGIYGKIPLNDFNVSESELWNSPTLVDI